MRFEKPKSVRNFSEALVLVAVALAKIQYQDPVSAAEGLPGIWGKVKGELEKEPKHIAWTFIASCVSTAGVMLLREPRLRCQLTDEELRKHAQELIDLLTDTGDLHPSDLTNLALSPHVQRCIEHVPQLIKSTAPDAGIDGNQTKQAYREMLARSVTTVFERQPDMFRGMSEAVQGATSTPERRDVAWKRHSAWVRGLFHENPIFSPDSNIDIPLASVYQPLRCYWNSEHVKGRPHERDSLKYRTATVAALHDTIDEWLKTSNRRDAVRLIAGGPGSGKSSFAKAFSAELINRNTHRVLFIQLQHLSMHGTLKESIGRHLEGRHGYKWPNKTEGFPENPLDWHGEDTRPILLIFDGLDELTTNKDRENDLTKKFVSNLKHVLNELNSAGQPAAAIVLGRDLAMDAAREDGDLSLDALIHVAPIRSMTRGDLRLAKNPPDESIADGFDPVSDPYNLLKCDSRTEYWKQWCKVQGMADQDPSPAITDERMSELNVEPLLLHLLIISEFCGDRWEQAAENRNLIYHDILRKVFNRNKSKELDAYKLLDETHFFELMEVFGLAAFRGNGRTGDHEEFERLRKRYANPKAERELYSELDGASLKNVALMVHSRRDLDGAGFEFVHKSFGEYLAARALLGASRRLQKLWASDENDEDSEQLALRWVNLIGGGQMSKAVLRFLRDECSLRDRETKEGVIAALSEVFDWTLAQGFPVHKSEDLKNLGYRGLERRQKCAETASLVTITSLWSALRTSCHEKPTETLKFEAFLQSIRVLPDMIDRLFPKSEVSYGIPAQLNGFYMKHLDLGHFQLPRANLSGADLSFASLIATNLISADLRGVELVSAHLSSAELTGTNLSWANLRNANLRNACLINARLRNSNLMGAYMFEANLMGAQLIAANLSEADLTGVQMNDADLSGAQMSGVKLYAANLMSANLSGAKLIGANLVEADLSYAQMSEADLNAANLSSVNLFAANLKEANLSEANLVGAHMGEAGLSFANLSGVDLYGANLKEANLSEADLSGAQMSEADLRGAQMSKADLSEADLTGAQMREADLSGAKLIRANLSEVDLSGVDLSAANLNGAYLRGKHLKGLDLSGVDLSGANII